MSFYSKIAKCVAVVSLAFLSVNCGTDGASPSGGGASSARTGGDLLAEGKRLYLTRCTSCHAPEPVADYSRSEWREIIPEMAIESKLSAAQERAVLQYVLSHSS
ncbi:MAG: mono/diheme cytochrome c family protein [Verrucomicrobiales bacterium]|jgi:mono/diheme cytochrome c family protein